MVCVCVCVILRKNVSDNEDTTQETNVEDGIQGEVWRP